MCRGEYKGVNKICIDDKVFICDTANNRIITINDEEVNGYEFNMEQVKWPNSINFIDGKIYVVFHNFGWSTVVVFDINMKDTIGKDREEEPYTEVKYLPKGYITPAALSIFQDYVIHWVWRKKKVISFVIKNKDINESFRNYFNLLWKQAKP